MVRMVYVDNFISIMLRVLGFFSRNTLIKLFESGTFPLGWSEPAIQPLHKKDDKTSANYRGIFLLNVSGKLYSNILNKRLTEWVEKME